MSADVMFVILHFVSVLLTDGPPKEPATAVQPTKTRCAACYSRRWCWRWQ